MTPKNLHWQRLRNTTMTAEERRRFFDLLRALGRRARMQPYPLETLLHQIEDEMHTRHRPAEEEERASWQPATATARPPMTKKTDTSCVKNGNPNRLT